MAEAEEDDTEKNSAEVAVSDSSDSKDTSDAAAAAVAAIPAARMVEAGGQTKAHQRLSAQTLFEFALPETVRKDGSQSTEAASPSDADSDAPTTAPKVLEQTDVFTLRNVGILLGIVAFVFLLVLFTSSDSEPPEGTIEDEVSSESLAESESPETTSSEAVVAQTSEGPADVQPETSSPEPDVVVTQQVPTTATTTNATSAPSATSNEDSQLVDSNDMSKLNREQLAQLLADSNPTTVEKAVRESAKRQDPILVSKMLELVDNPAMLVRVTVAKTFSKPGTYKPSQRSEVVTALLNLIDDKEYLVRGFAARALGASGDPMALLELEARLQVEENKVVLQILRVAIDELRK